MIKDFGEVIHGAKKEYFGLVLDKLSASMDENQTISSTLAQIIPEPDYNKLVESGISTNVVAAIRALRDAIPRKPSVKKPHSLRSWADNALKVRTAINDLLKSGNSVFLNALTDEFQSASDNADWVRFNLWSRELMFGSNVNALRVSMLHAFYATNGHGVSFRDWDMRTFKEESGTIIFYCREKRFGGEANANLQQMVNDVINRLEMIKARSNTDGKPDKKKYKFRCYHYRNNPSVKWIGYRIGKKDIDLKSFTDRDQMFDFLKNNEDELVQMLEDYLQIEDERNDANDARVGHDYRYGADVSPEMFSDTFGFRGVQFGNYVEQGRRQQDINNAYDALMDLSRILDIPPSALSLQGRLGLAFGARGHGKAMAHYEPGHAVINLTKSKGAGTLAHEWFHALDNHLTKQIFGSSGYLSESTNKINQDTLVYKSFCHLNYMIMGTQIGQRSSNLDTLRKTKYWGTTREVYARVFKAYVKEKLKDIGCRCDYLVNIKAVEDYKRPERFPYPTESEMNRPGI